MAISGESPSTSANPRPAGGPRPGKMKDVPEKSLAVADGSETRWLKGTYNAWWLPVSHTTCIGKKMPYPPSSPRFGVILCSLVLMADFFQHVNILLHASAYSLASNHTQTITNFCYLSFFNHHL